MQSRTTRRFWRLFSALPLDTQRDAKRAYRLFQSNPAHPGLQFKKLNTASIVVAHPLPHGRGSVTEPRASASGHAQIVMTPCLEGEDEIYSVPIGLDYRTLGVLKRERIVWYWIGSHSEYNRLT